MYSSIKRLQITNDKIAFNENIYESLNQIKEFFQASLKQQSIGKEIQLLHGVKLKFNPETKHIEFWKGELIEEFYAPREVRYSIVRDLSNADNGFEFNLNYRKHFKLKYSRSQANIQFFNFEYPEMLLCEKFKRKLDYFYDYCRRFSMGEADRPTLMIVANIIDDSADYVAFEVTFRALKGNKVVSNALIRNLNATFI